MWNRLIKNIEDCRGREREKQLKWNFSTPRQVICEDNFFDHTHGTAILLCGDCNGWYETGACKNVIIRNNRFLNALTANYQFTNAVISIYPEIPNLKGQKKFFHSGIVIENNKFETFDRPILYAKSTDGLIFKNNQITYNKEFQPFHWNKNIFFFERVNDVVIENNSFEKGFDPEKDMLINLSDKDAVQVKWKLTTALDLCGHLERLQIFLWFVN